MGLTLRLPSVREVHTDLQFVDVYTLAVGGVIAFSDHAPIASFLPRNHLDAEAHPADATGVDRPSTRR